MKLDANFIFIGLLLILSKYEMECRERTEFPPRRMDVDLNQEFSLTFATFTNRPFTYLWFVVDPTEIALVNSSFSDDFVITEAQSPGEDFIWKNTTITGSIKSIQWTTVFVCDRDLEIEHPKSYTAIDLTISATDFPMSYNTTLFNTTSTTKQIIMKDKRKPPRPNKYVLTNPRQGEVQLDWKLYPASGPHCLTYFNITYKIWHQTAERFGNIWEFSEQMFLNILDATGGSYSYTLREIPLNHYVKIDIISYCNTTRETKHKVSDQILILEHTAAQINGLPESRNVNEGSFVSLTCEALGFPVPTFSWTIIDDPSNTLSDEKTLIFNLVSTEDEGTYFCTASNRPNGTHTYDTQAVTLTVNPTYTTPTPVDHCAIVSINECTPYLNGTQDTQEAPVYYLLDSQIEGLATELHEYLLSITGSSVSQPCYRAGMKYLCNNLFRPCDITRSPVQTVSASNDFCFQDCIDFWRSDCIDYWRELTTSDIFRKYPWLYDCGNISSSPQTCTQLGIKSIIAAPPSRPPTVIIGVGGTDPPQPNVDSTTLPLIIGIVIIFVIIIIIAIGIIVLCVMYYRQFNKPQFCSSKFIESKVAENQFYSPFNNKACLTDKKEFPRSSVRFIRKLGQGQFGAVELAEASSIIPGEKVTLVAVKTLHEGATVKNRMDFEREADIMLRFDHPNILQLLGVSFKDKTAPLCLIFEYMESGDLNNYLRGCASSLMKRPKNSVNPSSRTESDLSEDPPILSTADLVNICSQISGGMHYLSVRSFVHRDLATRNCLVGKNLVVKIGDFGMSKDVYKSDYYRIGKEALLPIKWMAPEAIMYGKATIQTDIWSFGVLIWEVFSFAMQPWYGFTNEQVMEKVKGGEILSRPDNCPQMIYSLMLECWDMEPSKRITFESILQRLNSWRVSSTESASLPDIHSDAPDPFDDEVSESN